jgi:hypothetical protein
MKYYEYSRFGMQVSIIDSRLNQKVQLVMPQVYILLSLWLGNIRWDKIPLAC